MSCLAQQDQSTNEREEARDCPCPPFLPLGPKVPARAGLCCAAPLDWRVQAPGVWGGQVGQGAWERAVTGTASSYQSD